MLILIIVYFFIIGYIILNAFFQNINSVNNININNNNILKSINVSINLVALPFSLHKQKIDLSIFLLNFFLIIFFVIADLMSFNFLPHNYLFCMENIENEFKQENNLYSDPEFSIRIKEWEEYISSLFKEEISNIFSEDSEETVITDYTEEELENMDEGRFDNIMFEELEQSSIKNYFYFSAFEFDGILSINFNTSPNNAGLILFKNIIQEYNRFYNDTQNEMLSLQYLDTGNISVETLKVLIENLLERNNEILYLINNSFTKIMTPLNDLNINSNEVYKFKGLQINSNNILNIKKFLYDKSLIVKYIKNTQISINYISNINDKLENCLFYLNEKPDNISLENYLNNEHYKQIFVFEKINNFDLKDNIENFNYNYINIDKGSTSLKFQYGIKEMSPDIFQQEFLKIKYEANLEYIQDSQIKNAAFFNNIKNDPYFKKILFDKGFFIKNKYTPITVEKTSIFKRPYSPDLDQNKSDLIKRIKF